MGLPDALFNRNKRMYDANDGDEFCPCCDANLTLQKGYHNDLPYWNCLGCGEMLINPRVETDTDIAWICDQCESMLNEQPGLTEDCGKWACTKCGYINLIDDSQVYLSEEERLAALDNPYNGMADEDVIAVMGYEELGCIGNREDIIVVKDEEDHLYVKKILDIFDESVYRYLIEHPVEHMPRIIGAYKGLNKLVVIEEFIDGSTLYDLLQKGTINTQKALEITRDLCKVARNLHTLENPIIHRDIKPSNVMLDGDLNVYLLDVNVAKWYKPEETEDTRMLGTKYYAAPEQLGYGFTASTSKTDSYAIGMLLNMMCTGKIPKEEKATENIWSIIEKCISLNPEDRYSDDELLAVLDEFLGNYND